MKGPFRRNDALKRLSVIILIASSLCLCSSAAPSSKKFPYTYTSYHTARNCPTTVATQSLNAITVSDTATTTGPTPSTVPRFTAYANNYGNLIPQIVVPNATNKQILYQTGNSSRIVVHLPSHKRAVIDDSGVSFFAANCKGGELRLPVPKLSSVINSIAKSMNTRDLDDGIEEYAEEKISVYRRDTSTPVNISMRYFDACGYPLSGHKAYGYCRLQIPYFDYDSGTLTAALSPDPTPGAYSGACSVPASADDAEQCKKSLKPIIDYPATGFPSKIKQIAKTSKVLAVLFAGSALGEVAAAAAKFFAISEVAAAITALEAYKKFIQYHGDDAITALACYGWDDVVLEVAHRIDFQTSAIPLTTQTAQPFVSAGRYIEVATPQQSAGAACPACSIPSPCDAYPYRCPGVYNPYCACGLTVNGALTCYSLTSVRGASCSGRQCTSDADCLTGSICVADSCCGNRCATFCPRDT